MNENNCVYCRDAEGVIKVDTFIKIYSSDQTNIKGTDTERYIPLDYNKPLCFNCGVALGHLIPEDN